MNIILFDGVCNLCNSAVVFIIRRDKRFKFKFASLESDVGVKLCRQYAALKSDESIIYIKNGKCFSESTAVLNIFYDLNGIYRAIYILIVIPPFIRNSIYRLLARNRYRIFGKRDSCMVPSDDVKKHFVHQPDTTKEMGAKNNAQ